MDITIHSINHIVSNPKIRKGRPIIAGTTLRVMDVAMAKMFHRQSPDELATGYGLSLAQIHAALAYYYEHKAEIDADIREIIKTAESLKEQRIDSKPPFLVG
jgi:uncharacterized protein (DUF433 family)